MRGSKCSLGSTIPPLPTPMSSTPKATAKSIESVPPSDRPLLEMKGIYHCWKRQKQPVLDEVSLDLRPGEVTWIGGRNGAGKTTLLRLAAGILLPQRGRVDIGELNSEDTGNRYQRQIGFLSAGERSPQARMRVTQQLDYWARLAYVPRDRRQMLVDRALQSFGL